MFQILSIRAVTFNLLMRGLKRYTFLKIKSISIIMCVCVQLQLTGFFQPFLCNLQLLRLCYVNASMDTALLNLSQSIQSKNAIQCANAYRYYYCKGILQLHQTRSWKQKLRELNCHSHKLFLLSSSHEICVLIPRYTLRDYFSQELCYRGMDSLKEKTMHCNSITQECR